MLRTTILCLLLICSGCGGGEGDSPALAPAPQLPFIAASFTSSTNQLAFPPRTIVTASAQLLEQSPVGAPIGTGTISVNGTALTLDATTNRYSGTIDATPGASLTINVTVNGANYTAATTLLSGAPTLTSPAPLLATWNAAVDNLIQWTNAPGSDATAFGASIAALSSGFPLTAIQVWPANGQLQTIASGATSVTVPRNSLNACRCLVSVVASRVSNFPGAAAGSIVAVFAASSTTVTVN